ncbi:MAG: DUF2695 domain-containing protein [Pyrinomonadaceae bacterium]|nr:DUF2695 domain-containing protein [Pyrinomonadaceae bacterium]
MKAVEKLRRRAILRDLKGRERAQFIASIPASKAEIRDLFDYLDRADEPCDHSLNHSIGFIRHRGLPEEKVVAWLEEHGGYCDCEVIFNVEDVWNQMVEEVWRRN